jgi:hypothetical protein
MPARMLSLLVAGAIALAACSGGGGDDDEASSSTGPTSSTVAECLPRSSNIPREVVAEDSDFVFFTGIEFSAVNVCSDRITFSFVPTTSSTPPGYLVKYENEPPLPGQFVDDATTETTTTTTTTTTTLPPTTNADGTPTDTSADTETETETEPERVDVAGDAWLVVTFDATSGFNLLDPEVPPVYTGDSEFIPGDMVHVVEMQLIHDFDGSVVWVIGVEGGQRPFTVDSTVDPVVDPEEPRTSSITIEIG